jgi:hypothetical protein
MDRQRLVSASTIQDVICMLALAGCLLMLVLGLDIVAAVHPTEETRTVEQTELKIPASGSTLQGWAPALDRTPLQAPSFGPASYQHS